MPHFNSRPGGREPHSPDSAGRSGRSEGQQFRYSRNAHAREGRNSISSRLVIFFLLTYLLNQSK